MHYLDQNIGFSFDLPDGWRHDKGIRPLTFFGPKGRIGFNSELIQMRIGTILPKYVDPRARERFMVEPDAEVSRGRLGDETNVVLLIKPRDTEITAVRDGLHYIIAHANDSATQEAIQKLILTFSFPSQEKSAEAIKRSRDLHKQTIIKTLPTDATGGGGKLLENIGALGEDPYLGSSTHRAARPSRGNAEEDRSPGRWWQFWKW